MSRPVLGVSTHVFGSIQPRTQFPLLATHGLTLIELALTYFPLLADPDRFSELHSLLQANGICVSSCHLPYGETVPALGIMDLSHPDRDIRRNTVEAGYLLLDRLCQLGGRYLVVHPGSGSGSPAERIERLCHCIDSLRLLTVRRGSGPLLASLSRTCRREISVVIAGNFALCLIGSTDAGLAYVWM